MNALLVPIELSVAWRVQVLAETVRLSNIAPAMFRKAREDCEIKGN